MQRHFYGSALKYIKMRPLVFRRIIVWHHLLFSAWVRWDCFGGKQNNIIGSESLLPKATYCFKIFCIPFTTIWTGGVLSGLPCAVCCFLMCGGTCLWYLWIYCYVFDILCHFSPIFLSFVFFVSDWGFVVVFGAPSLWCVATRDLKLLFCVLASKKEGSN